MRHIVAHLIRGEAREAHENITKDLTLKFDTFPLHDRILPHLTLKRWFEMDGKGMETLYKCLDNFANSHKQSDYSLSGFGNFRKDVIYVDVIPSQKMSQDVLDLTDRLHEIPELTFDEFDNGSDFHATVAFGALKPFDYDQIWNYLKTIEQPNFKMKFDNVAILKKPIDKWIVDRVWEINP
ncbi:MAG TPA: 2'-5' RNA ligase family protein [Candidatus Paceibacterota bacterium]|nr:2'-5' RNA ligase family protein [Candidatus Paceibacterota bacterium]